MFNGKSNGIVDFDDIFGSSSADQYNREDDILPGKEELDKVKKTGGQDDGPEDEPLDKPTPPPAPPVKPADQQQSASASPVELKPVTDYKEIIANLVKRGSLPDMKGVLFGKEDGTEVSFDDMEIPNQETFLDIMSTIIDNQKESMLENKIDAASVSDFTKKLIQADKAGADVLDILKQYDRDAAPVEKLDPSEKEDQLKIIRHYVGLLGLPKDEAEDFYKGIVSKGDEYIEAKALKYKAELDKKMDDLIAERTRQAEEKRAKDAEDFKRFKKNLKASFQAKYQLNDNMVSKAMDFVLKPSKSNPQFSEANERIKEMLNDPEQAPDLIMFLMNPEEFVKQKSNNKVNEEKKRIFKMITTTSKDKTNSPVDNRGDEKKGLNFDEIELKD